MSQPFPLVSMRPTDRAAPTDLAGGRRGLLVWAAPLALLIVASSLGVSGWISAKLEEALLVAGTGLFGGLYLVNALRYRRMHCWIDGVGLPNLAGTGALGFDGGIPLRVGP